MASMGTESMWASPMGVMRLVAPGPDVATQTPGRPVTMAYPLYKIYECFPRVIVDEQGIRVGRRSCVWPESRSGLFVAGDRIFVVYGKGRHLALDGAGVTWGSFRRRQEQLVARCEAIWLWGVAHGATRETGRYVPLADAGMQEEREILERGIGLAVPRRGQLA